jgi:hypothetical protein
LGFTGILQYSGAVGTDVAIIDRTERESVILSRTIDIFTLQSRWNTIIILNARVFFALPGV